MYKQGDRETDIQTGISEIDICIPASRASLAITTGISESGPHRSIIFKRIVPRNEDGEIHQ